MNGTLTEVTAKLRSLLQSASNIRFYPRRNGALAMGGTKEFVWATGSTGSVVARRKIVAENIASRNFVLFEQPPNQRGGGLRLPRIKRVRFFRDVLDADRTLVGTHAMPGRIVLAHGLIDVAIAVDNVMGGDRIIAAGCLKMG